jgi:small-conductance mechanosensitive channel
MSFARSPAGRAGRAALLAVVLAVVLAAGAAGAQEAPTPSPAPPTAGTVAAPPVADAPSLALGARLDQIGQDLATSGQPTSPPVDLAAEADRVSRFASEVAARRELANPATLGTLAPAMVDSLVSSLGRIERDLTEVRQELAAVATQLEARRSALKADAGFLRAVLAVAGADELPPTLLKRTRVALRDIDATRDRLRSELDGVAGLTGQVSELYVAVTSTIGEIDSLRSARAAEVFSRDQPPLWTIADQLEAPTDFLRSLVAALNFAVRDYVADYPGATAGLAVLLSASLVLAFALRRASLAAAAAASLATDPVVQRPVAVAVLVWLVVGPPLFGLDPPLAIDFLRIIVAAVALWRLLPLFVPARTARIATAMLALAVVATTALLAGTVTANTRLALFVAGIAAAALLHRLARTGGPDAAGQLGPLWGGVLRVVVQFGRYVATAGVIANLVGAVSLGNQLVYGTLFGTLIPVLLATTGRVVKTILDRALERPPLTHLRAVRSYPETVRRRLFQFTDLLLVLVALPVLPRLFPFVDPLFVRARTLLATPLSVGGLNVSFLNVVAVVVGIVVALGAARLVRFLLEEEVLPRTPVAPGSAATASRLTYYVLVIIGLFMALAAGGLELSQLTLLVSALSVGIGFGLQNIVNNFVSGIVLAFERPIQPGDLVAVGTMTGRVHEIGLRATTVRTFEGADVIVPNSQFISAEVVNWTLADRSRRIEIPIGVAYGTDLRRAQQVIHDVVAAHPGVNQTPDPVVVFRRFGENSIDFSALFWAADADHVVGLTSEVGIALWEALDREGIAIPFPQRDVRIVAAPAGSPSPAAPPPPAPPRSGGSPPAAAEPPGDPE